MPKLFFAALLLIIITLSFKAPNRNRGDSIPCGATKPLVYNGRNTDSLKNVFKQNLDFFSKRLLKGHRSVIQNYARKYQTDTCGILTYKDSSLKADFEGIKAIKSIFINKKADTVFVMPPFNYCDDGESYCFYNKTLPRLYTGSYCCHPANFFVLPDIDEDGVREVGIYYSSCASRFKALIIYSLKAGRWKVIASSTFDIDMKDPDKTQFDTLVRKISKGKFKICDFADGKTEWNTVVMR
ncbi:MAG TPA: hypothetical protein VFE53_21820 [Mucilaginibacter sp.]|jgi:hypothetical protein|nr:hypothetical protein [Mucilaginibacter sp.]